MFINPFFSKCWAITTSNATEAAQMERIINVLRSTPANLIEPLATAVESHHLEVRSATQSLVPGSRVGHLVWPRDFVWPTQSGSWVPGNKAAKHAQSIQQMRHPDDVFPPAMPAAAHNQRDLPEPES
jgi:hypothetical protein